MKKKISISLFIIFMCLFYYADIKAFLYKRIHKGLVNYDFGILSIEDLRKSDENSFPATTFDGIRMGYPYWQCYNKKHLKKFEDCEDSVFGLDIETDSERHSYSLPHNISTEICQELYSEVKKILQDRTYFCIKGIDGTLDKRAAKKEYSWSFYGIKTKSGYANYREEEE